MRALGSAAPERHALSVVIWCEGVLSSCSAGSCRATAPDVATLRTSTGNFSTACPAARPGRDDERARPGRPAWRPRPRSTPDG
ncbi:hypothetical protein [Streptomyces sp. WMMC1477]|uniref:hypothetical protein n=1 Tax=Streptomyces sp. WMMC1477 TaxID=3015155 RepID=UPI0022B74ED5|nr:hypothetical protein [Streptomyces sp. WMMC1477]MCZ7434667.1 hypothetical protein [Streptomyces sp. WMMC1477]